MKRSAAQSRPRTTALPADRAVRFTRSALVRDSTVTPNSRLEEWLYEHQRDTSCEIDMVRLDQLSGWRILPDSGNLIHDSGRFFSVTGLRVRTGSAAHGSWDQPIINQPEIGILGLLAREFDGVLHFLVQAKMEPGNINRVQLAPTVQATRSNYAGVHRGKGITHIEYFTGARPAATLYDVPQSEQGAWFLHKRNRSMVVETTGEVPHGTDFRWLTIGQIRRLLHRDNLVNMNTRSLLACLPYAVDGSAYEDADPYRRSILDSLAEPDRAVHELRHVRSKLTQVKAHSELVRETLPLSAVTRWYRDGHRIAHEDGKYFRIVAADIRTRAREVARWSQPLIEPVGTGLAAFLVRRIDGILHLLVRARVEAGLPDVAEFGPTVQYTPGNHETPPPCLSAALDAPPERIRFSAVLSEEGARFKEAQCRYLVVEVPDGFETPEPDFVWMSLGQCGQLLEHGYYFTIQARTLLSAVHATW
ncbi:NDP-hexose 2,3-dehydratase family protein [Streptomyces sp. NPDC003032]